MSSTEDSDNETNIIEYTSPRTPPDLREEAELVLNNLLPPKSKDKYMKSYETFINWKKRKGAYNLSENVFLAYFSELAKTKKPSTLWATYSMLKSTVSMKHNVNIKQYDSLSTLLKRRSAGFKSIKSKIFTAANIEKFLNEAPDNKYLATKVALVLGVNGACRSVELTNLTTEHIIENHENVMIIKLCDTKTKIDRMCVVRDDDLDIVRKYAALRPDNTVTNRFFLTYKDGKCTTQPIGRHMLALMPRRIAIYLNLPDVERYTGHCFRRSSATLRGNSRANLTILKRHSGKNSHEVTESYLEESVENDHELANKINQNNFKSSSLSPQPTATFDQPLQPPSPQDLSFDEDNTRAVGTRSGRKRTESAVTEKRQTSNEHKFEPVEIPVAYASQKHEECEVYGRSIAHQIKDINDHQLAICQKIISDAIFFAKLNKLNEYSHIVTTPEPHSLQRAHFYSPSMPSSTPLDARCRHSQLQQQSPNITSSPFDELENIVVTVTPEESIDDPLTVRLVKSEKMNF